MGFLQIGLQLIDAGFDVGEILLELGHNVEDLVEQRRFVHGHQAAILNDHASADDDGLHAATAFGIDQLAQGAVERDEGRVGQIDQHQIGFAPDGDPAEIAVAPDGMGAALGGRLEGLRRLRRAALDMADGGQQTKQLHGLEHILGVGTGAIVAAEPEAYARILQRPDRRDAAFQLHIAQWVDHHVGAGLPQQLDFVRRQPHRCGPD